MTAIPVIETGNIRLRAPRMEDLSAYEAFCASDRSADVGGPFTTSQAFVKLAAVSGHWTLRGYGRFLVADRETDEALGIVGPYFPTNWPAPEIAWTVFGNAEGRSIAFEAAKASRAWAYETLGWSTTVSCIHADNIRSQRLAKRLGAVKEDTPFVQREFGALDIWRHPGPSEIAP
ncbi:MAG: GNAT family N-acetyltransferase [Pikeienuella sp.]